MKTLLLKELREHFKLAVIAMAVLAVLLVLAFSSSTAELRRTIGSMGYSSGENVQPLLAPSLLTEAAVFCAIFGALLGFLQIRAEHHPDLWAFLVHRPVPRTTILRSKILGGLVLYGAGAGLPLAVVVIVASIPGHVAAPFAWPMALALLSIFLAGVVCYLGGLLTGIRQARWYASRGVGLGPGVIAMVGSLSMPEFSWGLVVIVTTGALLGVAVWGSFLTGGSYRGQPVPAKLALALASVCFISLLLGALVVYPASLLTLNSSFSYAQFQVTTEGEVLKVSRRGMDELEVTGLDGQPVRNEKTGRPLKGTDLSQRFAVGMYGAVDSSHEVSYASSRRFFLPWRVLDRGIWYLTSEGRLVYYDGITRRLVHTLSPGGKSTPGAPDDSRFLTSKSHFYNYGIYQSYDKPDVLASARAAYLVNLEKRELRSVYTVTNSDAIQTCSDRYNMSFALLLTRASILLMDRDGTLRMQIPLEPSPPAYTRVNVLLLQPSNSFVVRFEPDAEVNQQLGGKLRTHLKWVEDGGTVTKSLDLPELPQPGQDSLVERCLLTLAPPTLPPYSWLKPLRQVQLARVCVVILCAGIGVWLGRRNQLGLLANIGWAIFHLVFGVPGLLSYLALQEWPAREVCPRCQALRAVNRARCEHCDAAFPPPARTGTEIFEPLVG
jgi:ABC-type transport system involved in multi-copper enzyme maturation permease subunit